MATSIPVLSLGLHWKCKKHKLWGGNLFLKMLFDFSLFIFWGEIHWHVPYWGPKPETRPCALTGIQPVTSGCMGRSSTT